MKKTILLSVLVIVFCQFVNGQIIIDYYTKNKIVKEISLSKNAAGTWDTSFHKVNQLTSQCAILKSSEFWFDYNTNKLYEDSRDSVIYLANKGDLNVYGSKSNITTRVLEKSYFERIRKRSQPNRPDTSIYSFFDPSTNTYMVGSQTLYYVNKWGIDSFHIARNYVNNVLTDTAYLYKSNVDSDGHVIYSNFTLYDNRQIFIQQKTGYTYINKKLTTQRDTSFESVNNSYYTITDFTYNSNGQLATEQRTDYSTSDTTKSYMRTRYISYNVKNKPLESIDDIRQNGTWVEDTRNLYTYQSDTLEVLKKSYLKEGSQWVEYNREIHEYCLPIQNAIEVLDKILDISLSPNPTNGQLNIQFADNDMAQTPFDLAIFNNSGQLMYQKTNCAASQTLNVEHLKDGFYVAKIVQNGRFKTQKLIVLH